MLIKLLLESLAITIVAWLITNNSSPKTQLLIMWLSTLAVLTIVDYLPELWGKKADTEAFEQTAGGATYLPMKYFHDEQEHSMENMPCMSCSTFNSVA